MSSSATNTFTNRRRLAVSANSRSAKPGSAVVELLEHFPTVAAVGATSAAPPVRVRQLRGNANSDRH